MIFSVLNSSLLQNQEVAKLTADSASGSSTLTVDNISGFSIGQYVLIGNFGEPNAEIIRIHASSAPSGTTITLASNTVNDHYAGASVSLIDFNQVEFSRATTLTGSKSVLTTVAISADRIETTYNDSTNTSGYGFSRFKNSATTTYSDYSDGLSYSGPSANSFGELALEACSIAGVVYGKEFAKEEDMYRDMNAFHRDIQEMQDWDFELVTDRTSVATTENENEYAVSGFSATLKHLEGNKAILDVRIGSSGPLTYISPDEMDREMDGVKKAYLSAQASVGATSITLDDSNDFSESGTISLGQNNGVAYTANAQSTGVLSGISASAITVLVASGGSVWQGVNPGLPNKYTIIGSTLIFNIPVSSTYAGQKIKVRFFKKLDAITTFGDTTPVLFYSAVPWYLASRIENRKKNLDVSKVYYDNYKSIVNDAMLSHGAPTSDETSYYEFNNNAYG